MNNDINKSKKFDWLKAGHITTLVLGSLLFVSGVFSVSFWFDEAYTIGLMSYGNLFEMIKISTYDVHPPFYYIVLWLFTRIFGTSVQVMRLFSVIGAIMFCSLGYTHVRRDFGPKVGFWFSFVATFLASTMTYALQIRMYSWAMYFVGLCAIYAFRMVRFDDTLKTKCLFALFSVISAYTHHFGLFTVVVLNLLILIYYVRKKRPLKAWFILAAVQIVSYIPGAYVLLSQAISGGPEWITLVWPDSIFNFCSYLFLGEELSTFLTDGTSNDYYKIIGIIFVLLTIAISVVLYNRIRHPKNPDSHTRTRRAAKWSILTVMGIALFGFIVSLAKVIFYVRYIVIFNVFLVFVVAYFVLDFRKIRHKVILATVMLLLLIIPAHSVFSTLYHPSQAAVTEYLDGKIDSSENTNDIFLFDWFDCYVVTANYPNVPTYFYNKDYWNVEKAYLGFGPDSHIIYNPDIPEIADHEGRIWVIGRKECYNFLAETGKWREASAQTVKVKNHEYVFELILMERQ